MADRARCSEHLRRALAMLAGLSGLSVLPLTASGQALQVEPSLATGATWTTNANFGAGATPRDDFIVDVSPALRLFRAGADLRIDGVVGVDGLVYANGSQHNQLLPHANLGLTATFAPNFLYLDAGVLSYQSTENAYGPRSEGISPVNSYTSSQYRLSPYIDRELTPNLRVTARSDNTLTTSNGADAALSDALFQRHSLQVVRRPVPLGLTFNVERDVTRFTGSSDNVLVQDSARTAITLAADPQIALTAIAGYERYDLGAGVRNSGNIYGGKLEWHPTERTVINTSAEHHFFGTGWDLAFTHHAPLVAWDLRWVRQASTYAERLFALPPGGDIVGLLNAAFTTRFPDPLERARIVQEFLNQRGLSPNLQSGINLYSDRLNLFNSVNGSILFIGPINTAAFSLFRARTEDLNVQSSVLALDVLPINLQQKGASFNVSHRLSPTEAIVGTYVWADSRGLPPADNTRSIQTTYRLQYTTVVSPRTNALLGVRRQLFNSTVNADATESAVFVNVEHRF